MNTPSRSTNGDWDNEEEQEWAGAFSTTECGHHYAEGRSAMVGKWCERQGFVGQCQICFELVESP